MYQSQARPRAVGRVVFAQQQAKEHPQSSTPHRDAMGSNASLLQSILCTSKHSRTIVIGALACLVLPVLSGCGVSFNKAAAAKAAAAKAGVSLSSISCGTQSLTGAQTKACSVYLSSAAENATVVTLTSSNAAIQIPSAVTVQAGATTTGFNAVSSDVNSPVSVTITATSGSLSQASAITLYPSGTSATLSSISCGTQSLTGPSTKACSVYLSGAADNATTISLSSSSNALQVPSTVTIAPGSLTTGFNATVSPIETSQAVTVTASTGGDSQSTVIQLLGSGAQPAAQHKVQLTWQAPTGSIAGYRVYRMTDGSSSYAELNSSVDTQTSYVDATVQSGQTYDYVVTSVDGGGVESAYSNPTTVTIP